jgi:hypothetical protein
MVISARMVQSVRGDMRERLRVDAGDGVVNVVDHAVHGLQVPDGVATRDFEISVLIKLSELFNR